MSKEYITDNNEFLADGETPNPAFGKTTVIDHPDPPIAPTPPEPSKAELMAKIQELLDAVQVLDG